MSSEHIKAFVEKFFNDDQLRGQMMGTTNREEWLDVARKSGFPFSAGEFADVLNQLAGTWMGKELSKDQLDAVSKGMNGFENKRNNSIGKPVRRAFIKS